VLVVTKANQKPHKNNQTLRFFAGIYQVNPQKGFWKRPSGTLSAARTNELR